MAKPGTQLKGKRRRAELARILNHSYYLTPEQEKRMLKEDAKMQSREPVKIQPMDYTNRILVLLRATRQAIIKALALSHKNCRCMLCEMVPMELGKIIDALEKD